MLSVGMKNANGLGRFATVPPKLSLARLRASPGPVDDLGNAVKDLILAAYPVDLVKSLGLAVEGDQGSRLTLIEVETEVDGIGGVIVSQDHVTSTGVTAPCRAHYPSCGVVGATVAAHAPSRETAQYEVSWHH